MPQEFGLEWRMRHLQRRYLVGKWSWMLALVLLPIRIYLNIPGYESADFQQVDKEYQPVTYVCDLAEIPVEDNRYDAIVFNQVMEHLPEPETVLRELARVLKTRWPNDLYWPLVL